MVGGGIDGHGDWALCFCFLPFAFAAQGSGMLD